MSKKLEPNKKISSKNKVCNICQQLYHPRYLKTHEQTHASKKPYQCTKCETGFNQRVHLKRHEKNQCIKQKSDPKKPWKNKNSNGSQSNQSSKINLLHEEQSNLKREENNNLMKECLKEQITC